MAEPIILGMKLKCGKQSNVFEVIAFTPQGWPIIERAFGGELMALRQKETDNVWKEHKEPIIHTRYVYWMRNSEGGLYTVLSTENDLYLKDFNATIIRVDKVTYIEED